ncbi:MAG: LppP/LprE family lipoprotein [Mycobacterium sp.]|uniref:LppP/LprE family lipoprotein n=1 Tax=Mycobacterium sp. TaxID=1785 RepID=UPI001EC0F36F|nr:LppP/LprE family lipoprotein [Mycobacterium sp.]MBW0017287.1 LppP/LprE family lipoprotein [Mycobacterium sp.]
MTTTLATLAIVALIVGLIAACDSKPSTSSAPQPPDKCKDSDGPTADTVQQAIAGVPIVTPDSTWVEIARGHTKKCRLYWVQIIPTIASESSPQQLLFFDHNSPLGSATPNPKPYLTVLSSNDDTVTVQYQWQAGSDKPCCPTGKGTVRFQIGSDGKLKALDSIPHQ